MTEAPRLCPLTDIGGFNVISQTTKQQTKPQQSKGAMLLKNQNATAVQIGTASNAFMKKIGKANYRVMVHFSPSSKHTFNDKLLRLVKVDNSITAQGNEVVTC